MIVPHSPPNGFGFPFSWLSDHRVALTVSTPQASMSSVPTAAPIPASEAWTAWKCTSTQATAVGPVPPAYRATAPTAVTSMRWGRAEPRRVQKTGVRMSGRAQEGGINAGPEKRNLEFRRGQRQEEKCKMGETEGLGQRLKATQGRSWGNCRGGLRWRPGAWGGREPRGKRGGDQEHKAVVWRGRAVQRGDLEQWFMDHRQGPEFPRGWPDLCLLIWSPVCSR